MSQSKGRKSQGKVNKVKAKLDTLGIVHPNAAGIDIGSREIWVALPPDRAEETVRCFGRVRSDLGASFSKGQSKLPSFIPAVTEVFGSQGQHVFSARP